MNTGRRFPTDTGDPVVNYWNTVILPAAATAKPQLEDLIARNEVPANAGIKLAAEIEAFKANAGVPGASARAYELAQTYADEAIRSGNQYDPRARALIDLAIGLNPEMVDHALKMARLKPMPPQAASI